MTQTIADNIAAIKARIALYEARYHRAPHTVELLAASKGQPIDRLEAAYRAGLRIFGENYLQEALPKIHLFPEAKWHFIGTLQKRKLRSIAEYFSWVHSVSSKEEAEHLSINRPAHVPALNICIQVNISQEASKGGIDLAELPTLAHYCAQLPRITLRGLMSLPAPSTELAEQRAAFRKVRIAWQALCEEGLKLDTLSMGMSNDMEAAIAEGSTIVRIGTAIFGERIAL